MLYILLGRKNRQKYKRRFVYYSQIFTAFKNNGKNILTTHGTRDIITARGGEKVNGYIKLLTAAPFAAIDAIIEAAGLDGSITEAEYKYIEKCAEIRAKELLKIF